MHIVRNTNDLKAEFSYAYVRAIAHASGYYVQEAMRSFDNDGVDLTLMSRGGGGVVRSPRLDVQVKATSQLLEEDPFPYDLEAKNYGELCDTTWQTPRILVVVVLPKDIAHWVSATEKELVLRYCGYWRSFRGERASENSATIRIHIPRSNCFHVQQLQELMNRIWEGGLP